MIDDIQAEAPLVQPPAELSAAVVRQPWYRRTEVIITLLVALSPVGLILMWVARPWQPKTRWIVTGVTVACSVALVVSGLAVLWLVTALVLLLCGLVYLVQHSEPADVKAARAARPVVAAGTTRAAAPQIQVRQYKNAKDYQRDATRMMNAGYELEGQTATEGHMNVGRTAMRWAVVGPLALVGGGSRTKGKITVTWVKRPG